MVNYLLQGQLKKGFDDAIQKLKAQRSGDKLACVGHFKPALGDRGFGRSGQLVDGSARRLPEVDERHARFEP